MDGAVVFVASAVGEGPVAVALGALLGEAAIVLDGAAVGLSEVGPAALALGGRAVGAGTALHAPR